MTSTTIGTMAILRRALHIARPYRMRLWLLLVVNLASIPLTILAPLPLKIAVDRVVGGKPVPAMAAWLLPGAADRSTTIFLLWAGSLMVAIALVTSLQGLANSLLRTSTGEKVTLGFRTQLFRHVQRLSFTYHDTRGSTDSTYRIQYDAPAIQWLLIDGIIPFVTAMLTLLAMVYVTARIQWQLAMVVLVIAPVLYVASRSYGPRIRSQWREAYRMQSSAMATVQEVLSSLRVVKAFGQEAREQERFVRHSNEGFGLRMQIALDEGMFGVWVGVTTAVGMATVLALGMFHVQSGTLTLGDLLVVIAYLTQLMVPLTLLSRMTVLMHASLASAERAFALLDEAPDLPERPDARSLARARGSIAFRGVSFAYGDERPVLRNVSFEIPPGARVGITGTTGAGKSTLINLLTRFYDPTEGQILLDGVDLRDYKLSDLRNQFAIVLQQPVLFSASVAENIAYARPNASETELIRAATAANAHDFIVDLPEGYASMVGERGTRLSGGQGQRVALARAFLVDAPILVLDEPTSSVDIRTEAAIIDAMERLMKGRTTFLVTHRLSTLRDCDVLLTIEDGRLVPQLA